MSIATYRRDSGSLERLFKLAENRTTVRTEITAGVTTFLTMAYIIFVNPTILSEAGVPFAGAMFATAPALILVGVLMISAVTEIKWDDMTEAIPAFLTILAMPLTFSIANGLALGFIFYPLLKVITGRWRAVSPLVYVLAVLFALRYIYLGGE